MTAQLITDALMMATLQRGKLDPPPTIRVNAEQPKAPAMRSTV